MRKEKISDEEEHWLNNDANDVDKCVLIQELEMASDFERGVAHLDSAKQKLLAKLKRLTGVLQTANMLDLEELVNMAEEQVSGQLTDEEIKNAVQEKCAGEQDREVNGGDDNNYVDKDPCPTRGEVLRAYAILRHYVRESGNMFARQMETILG
ncbi:hypothetical protein B0H14DRAFT_3495952 [Mycena olivaceomarginata]|nr:hypothetical protein B0H14DRAFT_3495952 [Mycena olivaceomarginata]